MYPRDTPTGSAVGVVPWLAAAEVVAVVSSSVWVVWPLVVVALGVPSAVASAVGMVSWLVAVEVVAVVSSSAWVVWPLVVVPLWLVLDYLQSIFFEKSDYFC